MSMIWKMKQLRLFSKRYFRTPRRFSKAIGRRHFYILLESIMKNVFEFWRHQSRSNTRSWFDLDSLREFPELTRVRDALEKEKPRIVKFRITPPKSWHKYKIQNISILANDKTIFKMVMYTFFFSSFFKQISYCRMLSSYYFGFLFHIQDIKKFF